MNRIVARVVLLSVLVLLLVVAAGCSSRKVTSAGTPEHLNPGAPLARTATADWYELIARDKGLAVSEFLESADMLYLRRPVEPGVELDWVTPVSQTLANGTTVMGYTLRYSDRIALMITPADKPLDAEAEAKSRTIDPDVRGNTHPWRVSTVRGTKGLARNGTVQKWQSGDAIDIPSALDWQERSSGEAPFVRYTLVGDVPVDQLQSLALQLRTGK